MIIIMLLGLSSCTNTEATELKYVFLFIGDGMSFNTVQLARDAIAARNGDSAPVHLSFSDFESVGVVTNYDRTSFIPDSASSGTSIATGAKTDSGKIAETSAGTELESIAAFLKKERGMKVGIITTANLNHATPGVFYAHSASRYNYYEIGSYLPGSDFDFFAGGSFLDPNGGGENLVSLAEKGGYTVLDSNEEILGIEPGDKKYLIIDPDCDSSGMMSFALDRDSTAFSLADYLKMGIDVLQGDDGFFIMCEGGRIDSALHANDARTAVGEMEAFSNAVDVALDFYAEHPEQTLILVTGDHETGGLSLGYTGTNYTTYFDRLFLQKVSYLKFEEEYVDRYKAENTPFETVLSDIEELFGLGELSDREYSALQRAWEKTLSGAASYTEEDRIAYSTRTPITAEVTRLVANRSGIGFSTYVHTAAPVGMWAKGKGEELFAGTYDNTDVYNKMYSLLRSSRSR